MEPVTRREFARQSALAGITICLSSRTSIARAYGANERLDIGVVGVANRGGANLDGVASENIVALCDVDSNNLGGAARRFPEARRYADFRRMIADGKLDAVVVSTADHTHAPATALALRANHHVYCEKPLTHTVHEARVITDLAKKHRRATQMGTQIHAETNYRRVVELVQAGAIGEIREVHVWLGGFTTGGERPTETPPVPASLDWDLWLGPAPVRPYHPAYAPYNWRGWWEFGSGTLGDFGCHHMDLPCWALGLRLPTTVEAEGPPVHAESTPAWLTVRYEFPKRGKMPPVRMTWYHGDRRPPQITEGKAPNWGAGTLFVGEKGMLISDYGRHVLLPEEQFRAFDAPKPTIPDSIGHHAEWIRACKTGGPTTCGFEYSGALSEMVLLGNVAYRCGQKFEWDARRMIARGAPDAEQYIRRPYRAGWTL